MLIKQIYTKDKSIKVILIDYLLFKHGNKEE